ncbi:MAG: hypothetical protein ISS70_07795 [Phycisphaerae bacterium]|nr:hypothetical protein [Phycisphaerae bacterium]
MCVSLHEQQFAAVEQPVVQDQDAVLQLIELLLRLGQCLGVVLVVAQRSRNRLDPAQVPVRVWIFVAELVA